MRANGLKKAIPAILLLLLCSIIGVVIYIFSTNEETLYISHESGIYSGSFDLKIFSFKKAKILYTTDGRKPQAGAEGTYEYEGPIELECINETETYSFQICCQYEDGTSSEIYTRDYILDPLGAERFSTTYILSLTGEEELLFGDEKGIFVRGSQYYEYMEEHPDTNVLEVYVPANYWSDTEVPVHAGIFLKDGTQIIEQECGVKIYGNTTREHNQKSFRLYARYEYDDFNEFSYPFINELRTEYGNAPIADWQRISFHNSGQDNDQGYIRTELVGALAMQSGFPDVLAAESATVYVNGEYMGVYWLVNTFDDRYFEEKYGDYAGEMIVGEGSLDQLYIEPDQTDAQKECISEYNAFMDWVETADLNDEANWKRVCDTIDVDNFAHYFALEYYTGNLEWPQANLKAYRYLCAEGEEYQEGTVFDGRYRYLLYDTDYSFGLLFLDFFGQEIHERRFEDFMTTNEHTALFRALSQRQDFRDLFASKIMYFVNVVFTRDNVSEAMYQLNIKRHGELNHMITNTDILKDSIWQDWGVGQGDMAKTEAEWAEILDYAEDKPSYVVDELRSAWPCGDVIVFHLSMQEEGSFLINGMDAGEGFDGIWLDKVSAEIRCDLPVGMTVDGYTVNSVFVPGESFILNQDILQQAQGELTITPVISRTEVQSLTVAEYSINDSQDYVVLQNNGTVALDLQNYALADSEDSLAGATLPGVQLEPGEMFYVYGAKYIGIMEENSAQVTFSWNDEEQIYLYSNATGVTVY